MEMTATTSTINMGASLAHSWNEEGRRMVTRVHHARPHVVLVQGQNKCCFIYSGDACCRSVLVGRRAQKPPKATTNRRRRRRRCHLPENIKILPSNDDDCAFELCGTRPPATHRAPRFLAPTRIVGRPSHVVETLVPFLKDRKRSLR